MKKILSIYLMVLTFNCYSATWKKISAYSEIDTSSIQRLSNGNVKFWVRNALLPEVILDLTNNLKSVGVYKDYSNYSYSLVLFEINCSKRLMGTESGMDYSIDNKLINSYDLPNLTFSSIRPDSDSEVWFKYLCKSK